MTTAKALALLSWLPALQPFALVSLKWLGRILEELVTDHWANNMVFETESKAALIEYAPLVPLTGY